MYNKSNKNEIDICPHHVVFSALKH